MCKLCEEKPVYEFTNKRKLCARCFINYFQKKFLFAVRKFKMIKQGDIIGYKEDNSFRGIVLKEMLMLFSKKYNIQIVTLPNKKANKTAVGTSFDLDAEEIIKTILNGNAVNLKNSLPVNGKIIKPLYLFLDKEIMLYAKLKEIKFQNKKHKETREENLLNEFEKTHPEVKNAVVKSLLKMYS